MTKAILFMIVLSQVIIAGNYKKYIRYKKDDAQGMVLYVNNVAIGAIDLYGPSMNSLGADNQKTRLEFYIQDALAREMKNASLFIDAQAADILDMTTIGEREQLLTYAGDRMPGSGGPGSSLPKGSDSKRALILFVHFTRVYNVKYDIKYEGEFLFYDNDLKKVACTGKLKGEGGVAEREGTIDQVWKVSMYDLTSKILQRTPFKVKAKRASDFK